MKETANLFNFLVVEDNEYFRRFLVKTLGIFGKITEVDNEIDAISEIKKSYFDVVIIDIDLNGEDSGFNVLKIARQKNLFSIMLTDKDDETDITLAYRLGCGHYLTKDQSENILKYIIKDHLSKLEGACSPNIFRSEYVTEDSQLINEINTINKRLLNNRSLLILGESGTGKTKVAELIHRIRGGKQANFVALNVAAIPENLLESELFGHVRGAFSGADRNKKGLLEMANEGTLFLDEIATMPLIIQNKLLKCLDEKSFYPVGATVPVKVKFSLISSTCEDIYNLIQDNKFRSDLYYRISGVTITIPPLRERINDIPLLIKHFLRKGSRQIIIKDSAMEVLKSYSWPGNIRELRSVVEELSIIESGEVKNLDLPMHIQKNLAPSYDKLNKKFITAEQINYTKKYGIYKLIEKIEAEVLLEMSKLGGNRPMEVIKLLQVCRAQYYKMLSKAKALQEVKTITEFAI